MVSSSDIKQVVRYCMREQGRIGGDRKKTATVSRLLTGMNDETHVEENLKIADQAYPDSLTEAELQLVLRVESKYRELMKVGCTGCRYCMPCPSGVNIPLCFEEYNNLAMVKNPDEEKFMYAARLGGAVALGTPEFASLCVQCRECVEKCPQHYRHPGGARIRC